MTIRILFLLFCTLNLTSVISAKNIKVLNVAQYNEKVKTLAPGDSIILADGVWKDARLVFKGKGEKGKYICLTAETFGKVKFEGESCLQISGEWLSISGLVFVNGYAPGKAVIDFRTSSKDYAYNCVLNNCVIDNFNQLSKTKADHWVELWGKKNTVEYCYFGGKTNEGTTLVIWPNDSNSTNNEHLINRNYFGYRPPLGVNGGETIRIGTSEVCTNNSSSIVEGNYFEHCNGEGEIISNKSGENKFLNNTFFECEGSLTLRHGNRAIVSGNWFIGNEKKNTGGVRIINEGHRIYNNFFYKLRGEEFRSALAIMNAIPNSPPSGYAPVKDVIIANNTFFDCTLPLNFCVGAGERNRIIRPESTFLINNLVYCPRETTIFKSFDKPDGIKMENNLLISANGFCNELSSVSGEVQIARIFNFDVSYTDIKVKRLPFIKNDILGQLENEVVIGAFQNTVREPAVEMASSGNCGPQWYKPID